MKNKEYFLNTDFSEVNLKEAQFFLEHNGWIIKSSKTGGKCRVTMYESEEDFDFWKDVRCSIRSNSFEDAFRECLISIQLDYKAAING